MTSSKFSLDASLYFLFNRRVILNATPVSCQRYDRTTFYFACVVTGSVRALPVDDTEYGGTVGGELRGMGGEWCCSRLLGEWGGGSVVHEFFVALPSLTEKTTRNWDVKTGSPQLENPIQTRPYADGRDGVCHLPTRVQLLSHRLAIFVIKIIKVTRSSSVPPGKCWNSATNLSAIAYFQHYQSYPCELIRKYKR